MDLPKVSGALFVVRVLDAQNRRYSRHIIFKENMIFLRLEVARLYERLMRLEHFPLNCLEQNQP